MASMTDNATAPMTLTEIGNQHVNESMRIAAHLQAMQQAKQHLAGLLHSWDDMNDADKLEAVEDAYSRLLVRP